MTLRDILIAFCGMLKEDFACCKKGLTPIHSSYPLKEANQNPGFVSVWLTRLLNESPDIKLRKVVKYKLWFAQGATDGDQDLRLFICPSDDHPLCPFINTKADAFYSVKVLTLRRRRVTTKDASAFPLYCGLTLCEEADPAGVMDLDISIPKMLNRIDEYFYRLYDPFFQSVATLDALQADRQPDENRSFAKVMLDLCCGLRHLKFGCAEDMLDANKRYELLQAVEKNRPIASTGPEAK
jgi:hypothetical protein